MTAGKTIKQRIEDAFKAALGQAFPEIRDLHFDISKPRETAFGDFAINAGMIVAKATKANPMETAHKIVQHIGVPSPLIASVEVAKPGFINVVVSDQAYCEKIREIVAYPDDEDYARCTIGNSKRIQVEFVSANPTGPLNVVSARAAAVGDSLVRMLDRIGFDVKSEFYINDSGTQVEFLGESLKARFREALGEKCDIPDGGYPGEYLVDTAKKVRNLAEGTNNRMAEEQAFGFRPAPEVEREHIGHFLERAVGAHLPERARMEAYFDDYLAFRKALAADHLNLWMPLYVCHLSKLGLTFSEMLDRLLWVEQFRNHLRGPGRQGTAVDVGGVMPAERVFLGEVAEGVSFDFARFAVSEIVEMQKDSLRRFGNRPEGGVHFDRWFRESSLAEEVGRVLERLVSDGSSVVEKEGAVWLKGGGEAEEWVIRRSTGQPTYFLSDIAYHIDKRRRGFEQVIDIWGPDHHSHVARMQAAMKEASDVIPDLEIGEDWLKVLIAQQVNLIREGKRVQMSKRAGEYVTLDDVVDEVGADVARFFFLMRRCSSHLDFDLDLARETSEENPVYYVQYAHARISSMIGFARDSGYGEMPPGGADPSLLTSDEEMDLIKAVADFDEVVIAAAMALEPHRITAYLIDLAGKFHRFYHNHRVVTDDRAMSEARLYLCCAVRTVLRSALSLIGVSAPATM